MSEKQISEKLEKQEEKIRNNFFFLGSTIIVIIGLLYSFPNLHRMKGDGISYLDLADAHLNLDFMAIANSSWSPLYPFLLSLFKAVLNFNQFNEFINKSEIYYCRLDYLIFSHLWLATYEFLNEAQS